MWILIIKCNKKNWRIIINKWIVLNQDGNERKSTVK
jgi:hypothetical protein